MLIKTDVNLPDKTVFSDKNWEQSLNVHLVEYLGSDFFMLHLYQNSFISDKRMTI